MGNKQQPKKIIHALNTPYPEPSWPTITSQLENVIIELLLSLLAPIGQYREKHVSISKGRHRNKKHRKKKEDSSANNKDRIHGPTPTTSEPPEPIAPPKLQKYWTVGFNSTVRYLENLSRGERVILPSENDEGGNTDDNGAQIEMSAIFVCKSGLPPVMTSSLSLLAATASSHQRHSGPVIIVPISEANMSRIALTLRQPRIVILGMLASAPGTEDLKSTIRNRIDPVDVPWIRDSVRRRYQPVSIQSEEVTKAEPRPKS